jgi:tetratricopeptide (TPR) repeat protein
MARTRGQAVSTDAGLIADRYRVEALLGQGGMGAVYAAVDTTSGKRIAIKTIRHSASSKVLELFKREFHTLHGLRHPNIIEVYDYGSDSDGPFYTMELLEGGDLGHAAPLSWRQVCSYLRQVATLLGLLHARRLLHRDVTPRNLWVLPDGRLKLIDFGALCPFGIPTEVVGTPPFIAPEWLFDRAAAVRVDQRADLYALGALGYWLLTSVHAYPARTMNDLPRAWGREPAPPSSLAKLVEDRALEPIPTELDALILSLVRSDPAARPATTELLIDRIDAIAGPTTESTDHAVRGYVRSKVFVGRRREQQLIAASLERGEGGAIAVEAGPGIAVATSGVDLELTARCRRAFEPLAAIGDRNIAGFMRRCTLAVASILSEDHAAALSELKALRDLMDSGARIRKLPDQLRTEFLGGCLFSIGILECWRQSPAALEIADRIESFSPMYAMNADQLRTMYYSGRGDRKRTEFYQQQVETRALQVGAAWQVVTLGPIDAHLTALWTHDVLLAKRAAAEFERLSREIPSMHHEAQRARATYLVLTGRFREAIDTMNGADANPTLAGWSRSQGVLARAHNRLGEHARARELCQAAIANRSEENLSFVVMNLHVQLELALADAALGDFAAARDRSDRLLARHAQVGPIALGALHETRARVALLERDLETCRAHAELMRGCYLATEIASLRELSERLFERLAVAERGEARNSTSPSVLLGDDGHLMTRMRLILTHTEATFERRAQRGLQLALELTGAHDGFVVSSAAQGGRVGLGESVPAGDVVDWAQAQLDTSKLEQTAVVVPGQTLSETSLRTFGELEYCVVPLGSVAHGVGPSAALVLGFRGVTPRAPNPELLAMIAGHLLETQAES